MTRAVTFAGSKAVRVCPDGMQSGADGIVAQIVEADAIARAVGKLSVALPLAREVGIDLDHMANIDDEQKWRPAISARTARA